MALEDKLKVSERENLTVIYRVRLSRRSWDYNMDEKLVNLVIGRWKAKYIPRKSEFWLREYQGKKNNFLSMNWYSRHCGQYTRAKGNHGPQQVPTKASHM